MNWNRRLSAFLSMVALTLPLHAANLKTGKLVGKIEAGVYVAHNSLFRVAIPIDPGIGGRIDDSPSMVTFSDDFGSLYRIDYIMIPQEASQRRNELGTKAFLEELLFKIYLPNTVWRGIPTAEIRTQGFSTGRWGEVLITWMFLPQGSAYVVKKGFKPGTREDSYRARKSYRVRLCSLWFYRAKACGAGSAVTASPA
jgi:hypothetical protein